MTEALGFSALIYGCAVCDSPPLEGSHCSSCGITRYCSTEHKASHQPKHNPACGAVVRARCLLESTETELRASCAPDDPFTRHAGAFWAIAETRPFMLARMDLVKALRRLRTCESVREQLRHVSHMLELSPCDEMMARISAPALLLRLGRDQACYDLLRRWRALGRACGYRWERVGRAALRGCEDGEGDVFEGVGFMCDHDPELNDGTVLEHGAAMALLKIKLVIDIGSLQKATIFERTRMARRLPREILDNIRSFVPRSTAVSSNRRIMDREDFAAVIDDLDSQIDDLYCMVKTMSSRFWPVMLDHYDHFEGRFRVHDRTGAAECPGILRNTYDSWIETPGALDYVRAKVRGDPTSLKFIYLYG